MRRVGEWIARVLRQPADADVLRQVRAETLALCREFPLYR
jgi:glycine/serine hydroxymethyltransferase